MKSTVPAIKSKVKCLYIIKKNSDIDIAWIMDMYVNVVEIMGPPYIPQPPLPVFCYPRQICSPEYVLGCDGYETSNY